MLYSGSWGATKKSLLAVSVTGFESLGTTEIHKYVVIDQMNPQNGDSNGTSQAFEPHLIALPYRTDL